MSETEEPTEDGTGDVKYHHGAEGAYRTAKGQAVTVALVAQPESPRVRGTGGGWPGAGHADAAPGPGGHHDPTVAMPVVIHGDAAFAGQGVVAEMLNLGALAGYRTGGTLHLITNNQVGFTTDVRDARSTRYACDLAKGFDIPIIHVNARRPRGMRRAVRLAMMYRDKFHEDALIDLVGYRRHGHNEGDEPTYTQPLMYARIKDSPPTARDLRPRLLAGRRRHARKRRTARLPTAYQRLIDIQQAFKASISKGTQPEPPNKLMGPGLEVETAVAAELLVALNEQLLSWPDGFTVHPKLRKQLERRRAALGPEGGIDWAHAEALALASLLTEGAPIRLTGQDTERGTFSQRHLVLHDAATGERLAPMQRLPGALAPLELYNSPLSRARHARLRVRLQRGGARSAGALGGAVRRLHQRRPGDRGPVHQRRASPSGGSPPGSPCSCRTATRARGRSTRAPGSSGSSSSRPRATSGSPTARRRPSTSICSAARRADPAAPAGRDDPQEPAAASPGGVTARGPGAGPLPAGDRRRTGGRSSGRDHPGRALLREDLLRPAGRGGEDDRAPPGHRPAGAALLVPLAGVRAVLGRYPRMDEMVWAQEEPGTWAPGATSRPSSPSSGPGAVGVGYIGRPERASPAEGYPAAHAGEQGRIIREALEVRRRPTLPTMAAAGEGKG